MPRKRTELGPAVDAEIAARTARGESAETIFGALGGVTSTATIRRRQQVLRVAGSRGPKAGHTPTPAAAGVPDTIPENTPVEDLSRWIKRLETAATRAEVNGNLGALSSIASKVAQLMALRHRATPMPKQDPNERPDYIELARKGEERLLTLIKGTFREQASVTRP